MSSSGGHRGRSSYEEEAARAAARVTRRAIRRLDIFEWFVFAGALAIAILGGWVVALLIAQPLGLGFRPTWAVIALSLFLVAGGIAIAQMRSAERPSTHGETSHREGDDG